LGPFRVTVTMPAGTPGISVTLMTWDYTGSRPRGQWFTGDS